ncbi:hypothetical protein DPMN_163793 [Dreissena polymorpha]|uniref:Uncharacterized protein n=1 Tax=Dreissena polymorpha TaxID=45954 RepID=A0A9D4ETY3_DREPO|nr:hypothetical protein DPMN_163793 [Dreissena polymorpha]
MERTVKAPAYGVPSYLPSSTGRLCVRSVGQNREHSVVKELYNEVDWEAGIVCPCEKERLKCCVVKNGL